jgi:tripartite-type tricarboxylate transporter receptor subunit TctC
MPALSALITQRLIGTIAALGLLACSAGSALSQGDYPNKLVRMIVPFAAGASTDLTARLFAQKLGEQWGQQIIVDNRGGAGGGVGAEFVAKSAPDGYTLMVTNQGPSILNVLLRKDVSYAIEDFAPIVEFGYSPLIIVANPQFPPNNMKELIAYAKANPGKVNIGSSGANSNVHIALEILKLATGTDIVHVPYRGTGPSLNDVVSGAIQGAYTTTVSAEGLIKSGRVKVLGIAGAKRSAVVPEIATFSEQGIKHADANVSIGLVAPAKTPQAIMDKINRDVNQALKADDVRARFAQWGLEIQGGAADDYRKAVQSDIDRITPLIKSNALTVQ